MLTVVTVTAVALRNLFRYSYRRGCVESNMLLSTSVVTIIGKVRTCASLNCNSRSSGRISCMKRLSNISVWTKSLPLQLSPSPYSTLLNRVHNNYDCYYTNREQTNQSHQIQQHQNLHRQLIQIRNMGKKPYYWETEDVADHDQKIEFDDDDDKFLIAPLVVCGPCGVGTRAIIKRFLQKHSDLFASVVSHTNRLPKRDEENGIDFNFVNDKEMEEMIFFEDLFEHSTINGKIYGTAYHSIFRVHGDGGPDRREIMDIDMYGVKRLKEVSNSILVTATGYKFRPKYIFIAPPDLPTLRYRLETRGTESAADRETLLQLAEEEIHYGMSKAFHARVFHVDLDQAVNDFTEAVGMLYERMGRKILTDELDRLRQPEEEGKLFRREHRNQLIQSLDNDAINPIGPQDSRVIRQARRKAWVEEQKQLKLANKALAADTPEILNKN